jgi:O-antigen/teichoic acid export membrane protein
MVMGPAIALLWPSSFYASALTGLEQQPRLNALAAFFATLRYAGVIPVLYVAHAGLQGFLWWYVGVAALQTACSAVLVWRLLPPATLSPRFHVGELIRARQFALGIFVITATSLALSQVDRLTVSALRPLAELGYYTVAVTVSGGFGRLVQPMFNAIYPRMSRLVAGGDQATLRELYRLATQGLAVVISATALVLVAYARDVLWLWTGDAGLADRVATPMAILIVGAALNGLMNAPYALLLAHGRTRLPIASNAIALLIGVPFCYLAVQRYGLTGAAMLWLSVNVGYLLVVAPLIHSRLLQDTNRQWYMRDVLPAFLAATAATLLAKQLHPALTRDIAGVTWLAAIGAFVLAVTALASGEMRNLLRRVVERRRGVG